MLFDHLRPPITELVDWPSVHSLFSALISIELNRTLPAQYMAAPQVKLRHEVDSAVFESVNDLQIEQSDRQFDGGVATATLPPKRVVRISSDLELIEVRIFERRTSTKRLVATIEIVSPSNKDSRGDAPKCVAKIGSLIHEGIGVSVIDFVAPPQRSLHYDLLKSMGEFAETETDPRYLAAYRRIDDGPVEIWHEPLTIGQALPTLAIPLLEGPVISLPLEPVYAQALTDLRIDIAAMAKRLAEQTS